MVTYNDTDNALELADDDKLKVGDYELGYSSANDQFEIVGPEGDVKPIPRSTSGSLVPQGLAESVSQGKALADDGNMYDSVQNAVDNASGWVFVGAGTFNESVTISTAGLTLEGCGYDTLIDGGTTGDAIEVGASNVTVQNLSVQTTAGAGNDYNGVEVNSISESVNILNITIRNSDNIGIRLFNGSNHRIVGCNLESSNGNGISCFANYSIIKDCSIKSSVEGIRLENDTLGCIISSNTISSVGTLGVYIRSSLDNICVNNRISNSGDHGIAIQGSNSDNNIVANNRVSDSTNADITNTGTGNVLDDNLTGASN